VPAAFVCAVINRRAAIRLRPHHFFGALARGQGQQVRDCGQYVFHFHLLRKRIGDRENAVAPELPTL
jgi:hypothetical protein